MFEGWQVEDVAWPDDPVAAVRRLGEREVAWLDGGGTAGEAGRFGMLCWEPRARVEATPTGQAALYVGDQLLDRDDNAWRLWRRAHTRLARLPPLDWPLSPGWVGYVGFETARQLETLPQTTMDDFGLPLLRMALFDRGIIFDHNRRQAWAVRAEHPFGPYWDEISADDDEWIHRWNAIASTSAVAGPPEPPPRLTLELLEEEYRRRVTRALEYIAAGDIYQVNLAQRLRLDGLPDPLETYAAIRETNPAPYGALLRWNGRAIASASPELFLRVRGDEVLTRPIKGTRPVTGDEVLDDVRRRELLASEKDAAELAMIVDLHRNDLGRVCSYGSVRVVQPRLLERHPRVLHTVAEIAGRLRPEHDALDLLRACFPAGSISGVPKVRALEIIDELEPVARGAFSGAIGVLGLDGQMCFNVAIRTLQIRGRSGVLHVGGGIVADSDPGEEYEETLTKARGILEALRVSGATATRVGASAARA